MSAILRSVPTQRKLRPEPPAGAGIVVGANDRDLQFRPTLTGWTPSLMAIARAQADGGNLLLLADLVDAMMADDHIEGTLQSLTLGTFGLPLQIDGGSAALRARLEGIGKNDIGGEWNSMHPESELTQIYNWGVMLGVGLYQRKRLPRLAWEPQKFRLRHWHPRFLSFDHEGTSGSHWRVQTRRGMVPVLPGGQFGLFLPYGESRPWNQGKSRKCEFPWIIKHFAIEDRANMGQMAGNPILVGSAPQGATEAKRRTLLAELVKLARNGRIALPAGWTLDMLEMKGRLWELFSDSSDWADQAMTISIVSQVTTTEGSPGFDSGKPQENTLANITRYFAKQFATCLYDGSLKPWAFENTGDADDAPCGWWNTERSNSQASQATMFETLGRAGPELDAWLARSGLMVDAPMLTSSFGVPTKSDAGAEPMPSPAPSPSPTPPKPDDETPPIPGASMNDLVMP